MTRLPRRTALLAALAPALLAGCGFQLRQPVTLGYRKVALTGFAKRSPMAEALRQALPPGTEAVDDPQQAEVVVVALSDRFTRTVVASTSAGEVREFRLRVLLKCRLTRPDGHTLTADTEMEQSRDLSYSESAALGKEAEEALLLRAMRADIARQLLQMLEAAGRTGLL